MIKSFVLILGLFLCGFSFAQLEGRSFYPVESESDYEGIWVAVDKADIKLFEEEEAPVGTWLILYKDKSYFSSFISPEMGASVDVEFDYTVKSHTFNCRLIGSNSLGYYMQHENQAFGFELYYSVENDETRLLLTNDFGTSYELVQATEL